MLATIPLAIAIFSVIFAYVWLLLRWAFEAAGHYLRDEAERMGKAA